MTQVTPASDIWSVGCLIIELLTGYPPYYDLQPMSALFRIVQVCSSSSNISSSCLQSVVYTVPRAQRCSRFGCKSSSAELRGPCGLQGYADTSSKCVALCCSVLCCTFMQDLHPPLPENVSPLLDDFLLKCFQKVGPAAYCHNKRSSSSSCCCSNSSSSSSSSSIWWDARAGRTMVVPARSSRLNSFCSGVDYDHAAVVCDAATEAGPGMLLPVC
jgi:serine/threonine protein kinase